MAAASAAQFRFGAGIPISGVSFALRRRRLFAFFLAVPAAAIAVIPAFLILAALILAALILAFLILAFLILAALNLASLALAIRTLASVAPAPSFVGLHIVHVAHFGLAVLVALRQRVEGDHHPVIMVCVLVIVFHHHTVSGRHRIARHGLVFLVQLSGGAAQADTGPVAVERLVAARPPVLVVPAAAAALIVVLSHLALKRLSLFPAGMTPAASCYFNASSGRPH